MSNQLTDKVVLRHGAVLNNRMAMSPMQTHSGKYGGFVSDDMLRYYNACSKAAGFLIIEFHYVSPNGGPACVPGYLEQLGAYSGRHLDGLRQVAQALKKGGNKAILQTHHGGRAAIGQAVSGQDIIAPSQVDFSFLDYPIRELTTDEIDGIIKDFGKATRRAIKAGFDGVKIHGASHYLIQQFLSKLSNFRTDKWGGSLEKRIVSSLAVVAEAMDVVTKEAPQDLIVGYHISPEEIHGDAIGCTYKESVRPIAGVVKYQLDYIHLPLWDGYSSRPQGVDKTYAKLFRGVLDDETKLMLIGGVFEKEAARNAIENYGDLIAVGRDTLVDPLFAGKVMPGQGDTILGEVSPEILDYIKWTPGLFGAFSRQDSLGLPKIPGAQSIYHLHTGRLDIYSKK